MEVEALVPAKGTPIEPEINENGDDDDEEEDVTELQNLIDTASELSNVNDRVPLLLQIIQNKDKKGVVANQIKERAVYDLTRADCLLNQQQLIVDF